MSEQLKCGAKIAYQQDPKGGYWYFGIYVRPLVESPDKWGDEQMLAFKPLHSDKKLKEEEINLDGLIRNAELKSIEKGFPFSKEAKERLQKISEEWDWKVGDKIEFEYSPTQPS